MWELMRLYKHVQKSILINRILLKRQVWLNIGRVIRNNNKSYLSYALIFRLGGSECLDYISIYHNQGSETSSPHWHYVTFGFSDLHGDGRVHK
jgi:hypothetical protein